MVEAINTDHEMYTLLWWSIGVTVLAVVSFTIMAVSISKDWNPGFGISLAIGAVSTFVAIILWAGVYLPNHSDGSYNKSVVTGEITAVVDDIVVLEGVPLPVDLGDSSGLVEVGDVISGECKEYYGEFDCYDVELVK